MKALLALTAGALLAAAAGGNGKSSHALKHLDRIDVYDTSDGGYYSLKARGWDDDDGGMSDMPALPVVAYVLSVVNLGPCTDATLCVDGGAGVDPTAPATPDCACAVDATCKLVSDGGAAPKGMTLSPGTWTGAGCTPKACVALFTGGADGTWPAGCPLQ